MYHCRPLVKKISKIRSIIRRFYSSQAVISELEQRELISQISNPKHQLIESLNNGTKIKLYCGVDPTASSVHLGNLVPMMVLLHFYIRGHDIVNIVGGATGQVGDPSGRTTERSEMVQQERNNNVENISRQLRRFFQNGKEYYLRKQQKKSKITDIKSDLNGGLGRHFVLNNLDWWKDVKMLDFLANYGKYIRVQQMLSRDSITSRLYATKNNQNMSDGLGFNEFTYQILQAYDFFHLYSKEGVTIQVGGNDQWGNIVAGIDLIQKLNNKNNGLKQTKLGPYGITVPLLTTANGTKFGKSAGNAIFIDPQMNTPFDLYQFFYNTLDEDVERFLKIFTLLPQEEIESICEKHSLDRSKHLGQSVLAKEVTELIHGAKEAHDAEYISIVLFRNLSTNSSSSTITVTTDINANTLIPILTKMGILYKGQKEWDLLNLLVQIAKISRKEAKRRIEQGSVSIGLQKGNVVKNNILPNAWNKHLLSGKLLILRLGKQKVYPILMK
ncbi:tyrosine--tRNA ligase MSY1 PWA37_000972 [Arxiozyma heterogenica]|uniref:tyrosine--tRNA ligase MSY1 n=1 Tax=Arxiozyma heterogenica TaxID=278026 RepID=UPI002EE5E0DD